MQTPTAIHEYTERLGEDARAVTDDVIELVSETQDFARTQLVARPYTTLGVAAGIGYLLGAGLPRWVVRAAVPVLTRAIASSLTATLTQGYDARNRNPDGFSGPDFPGHKQETTP